tara:strand:- start:88 stop:465 length:378 start_codon:yes stop_codon:yes gene_type:complete
VYNVSKFEIIKQQLSDLQSEILSLDSEEKQVPELIEKTNLLRENELLKKLTEKQSSLIDFYLSYTEILEDIISKFNTHKLKTVKKSKNKNKQKTISSSKRKSIKKSYSKKRLIKHKTKKKSNIRK